MSRGLSGIQPTGYIHIGNYLGAIKPVIKTQKDFDHLVSIVDLHTLTVPERLDPETFKNRIRAIYLFYIAAGFDKNKIFAYSCLDGRAKKY